MSESLKETEEAEPQFEVRTILDFASAWKIQNAGGLTHHPRCSSVPGWHRLSGPSLLCDCGAVMREHERRLKEQEGKGK